MLQLGLTTTREVLSAAIGTQSSWVPKSNWRLHAKLVLEGAQRRRRVQGLNTTSNS